MSIINLSKDNFDSITEQNEIVLIDFWAGWCGPCQSFASTYETVSNEHPDIVFAKIDIEKEKELASDFNVRSIPLLMVFKQKVIVFSEAGLIPASGLRDLIKQAQALDMQKIHAQIAQQEQA